MLLPCGCGCKTCNCDVGTTLPYTITAQFAGLKNRTHTLHQTLAFESTFGSGAEGVVLAPGGCDDDETDTCGTSDRGPITSVLLTNPGSGYAVLGRRQPSITVSAPHGTGATFTPTITNTGGACGVVYSIGSISVSGGSGYVNGTPVAIDIEGGGQCGCTTLVAPVATLYTARAAPTVTASVAGVGGAEFVVALASLGTTPATWRVDSITVTAPGTGGVFSDWTAAVTLTTDGTTVTAATATATANAVNPGAQYYGTGGSGVGLAATIAFTEGNDGHPYWSPSGITINSGGSGYAVGDYLEFRAVGYDGETTFGIATYYVDTVDSGGAVLTVTGPDGDFADPFRKISGVASVTVDAGGAYYKIGDVPESVSITIPGQFWCDDPEAPPCVADITVTALGKKLGSTAPDAQITATVDSNTASATFGQIVSLSIVDGGDDYLAWHWICGGDNALNSEPPFVLRAADPKQLVTLSFESCHGCGAEATIDNVEPGTEGGCPDYWHGVPSAIPAAITMQSKGHGYALKARVEPSGLPIYALHGSGATFTPTFEEHADACGVPYWTVTAVAVSGGTDYDNKAELLVDVSGDYGVAGEHMRAILTTGRTTPIVYAAVYSASGTGSGATLKTNLVARDTTPQTWRIDSVDILSPGSGYGDDVRVIFSVTEFGATSSVQEASAYAKAKRNSAGEITEIEVLGGGRYWKDSKIPESVDVRRPGNYYLEDSDGTPYVASVAVHVTQYDGSSGSGAELSAVIGTDPHNPGEFGKILSVTVTDGGSGYSLFGGPRDCRYIGGCCCETVDGCSTYYERVEALAQGGQPLDVVISNPWLNYATHLRSSINVTDCTSLPSAELWYGAPDGSVAITNGGEWNQQGRQGCKNSCCPLDFLTAETCVNITSDLPCNGGTASYSGPWGNAILTCTCTRDGITYEGQLNPVLECCPKCMAEEDCPLDVTGTVSGNWCIDTGNEVLLASVDTRTGNGENNYCVPLEVTDGQVTGTLTLTGGPYTVTIAFGGPC